VVEAQNLIAIQPGAPPATPPGPSIFNFGLSTSDSKLIHMSVDAANAAISLALDQFEAAHFQSGLRQIVDQSNV